MLLHAELSKLASRPNLATWELSEMAVNWWTGND